MKLMVIKAVENRLTKDVIINPEQVESIEAAEGMCRLTMASGRSHYTELDAANMYTLWMLALNPDMEAGYNAGLAAAQARYEAQAKETKEDENNG